MGTNPLNITVHNNTYTESKRIGHYISAKFTEEFGFTAGTGELVVEANHPLAPRLMQADRDVVPVTAEYNGWLWTGRVHSYVAAGKPGRETLTVSLISDEFQLANLLAFSSPRIGLSVQKKRDYQTGPLMQVVYHYLAENLARTDLPAYVFLPPPKNKDKSPKVDASARMTYLPDLLRDVLDEHDYGLVARMWWPGQPFPDGKFVPLNIEQQTRLEVSRLDPDAEITEQTLEVGENSARIRRAEADNAMNPDQPGMFTPTSPGLLIQVTTVRDRQHVRFSTSSGEVESVTLSGKAAGPVRAVVGGKSDEWVGELVGAGIDIAVQGITTAVSGGVGAAAGAALGAAAGPVGMATGAIVGAIAGGVLRAQTEDTIFAFTDRVDVKRRAAEGPFHLRESFTSSSAGVFTYDTAALAERALLDAQGGQTIEMTLVDGRSKILGDDAVARNGKPIHGYRVGDRVQIHEHLSGVTLSDIVTAVEISDAVGARARVTPRVGKKKNTSNPYLKMVEGINRVGATIRDLGLST
ncbi:Gp37-like protein [Corynebacterium liangguodongii]|uniref:Gp28/Gp37-like domain-containing protein n=1 Tax=Corynebacterium liangguodongii TaxID=2079535 RepID=A0A2S0WG71_9CORY|nr:hypothetical protein [Corynebacterium liangguodongii]AWB84771.1 hypothetical protein C3E79_10050 [Corynebacterium liangguodongii]PWB99129.1 hypothetical protein DF219_07665 [Corynebacterium liangguodongii]